MAIKRIEFAIHTEKMAESKKFYCDHFGFELVFEDEWFIELSSPILSVAISFVRPQREAGEIFSGHGLVICFRVDDVESEYQRLKEAGLEFQQGLQNKTWGERSCVIHDPNGIHIYLYQPAVK